MELRKIHGKVFDTDETILCASLINASEWVMLLNSGSVIRYKVNDSSGELLFSVKPKSNISYSDGDFDLSAPSSIYVMDPIIVVVNHFKRLGILYYPGKYHAIRLFREDYHSDISRYPIALFKDQAGSPLLVYPQAWNHIQILDLDTRRVLTATKSLITQNAEEEHIEFYKSHPEDNKLLWPRPYDYFFGQLIMSPNNKKFLSKGWVWGSADAYNVYDVDDFINNSRISFKNLGYWEHCNRPACWIDDTTMAVTYYPFEDEEREVSLGDSTKLHFYDVSGDRPEIIKTLVFDGFDGIFDELYYSKKFNALIGLHKDKGLIVCNMDGQVLLKDDSFKPDSFALELDLFITVNKNSVCIHELSNTP